jgi:hypothetical protein
LFTVRTEDCGGIDRVELVRYDGVTHEVVAYLDDRCNGSSSKDGTQGSPASILFDPIDGRFVLPMKNECTGSGCGYPVAGWTVAIEGFATTFEVLQTYTPTVNEIGFRVPYMPEGFQYADYFDTYWGDLATVGDWSQSQPLQCGYPASPPTLGDYLTIGDNLPALEPGQGRYYVTAAHHQGQTRYGRKSSGGVLTGRDPTVLSGCGE